MPDVEVLIPWRLPGFAAGAPIIAAARTALRERAPLVDHERFPFRMHHDYYRSRIRRDGVQVRQRDVARALSAWAAAQPDPDRSYALQAIAGAVLWLAREGRIVHDDPAVVSAERHRDNSGLENFLN